MSRPQQRIEAALERAAAWLRAANGGIRQMPLEHQVMDDLAAASRLMGKLANEVDVDNLSAALDQAEKDHEELKRLRAQREDDANVLVHRARRIEEFERKLEHLQTALTKLVQEQRAFEAKVDRRNEHIRAVAGSWINHQHIHGHGEINKYARRMAMVLGEILQSTDRD